MNERREGGWWRCGWWRYPGAPVRVVLAFTAAGLVVIALLPALTCFLPNGGDPPKCEDQTGGDEIPNGDDPLKDMAEALQGIKESLSAARDLSITVKLDEDQWKEIKTELWEAAGLRGCGDGLTCKVNAIADSVKNIAARTKGMARPWACEASECLGAVHFPHDWPEGESIDADGKCGKREWKESGSKEPMRKELNSIITKLKNKNPSQPVWIVGHANTLGTEPHNDGLSMRRAKFVACHLEKTLEWGNNVHFETCAVGERGSADSLRHPDAWYRVVQVFAKEPQALTENPSWECSE